MKLKVLVSRSLSEGGPNPKNYKLLKWNASLLTLVLFIVMISCNDDEIDSKPKVKTGAVTDISGTMATVSGEITSDGGHDIISSGFVYSTTNELPELGIDAFTEETAVDDMFSSDLEELESTETYHIRAYAVNKKGIGYGAVVDFETGNAPPIASDVTITGELQADLIVTATYTYSDSDGDLEAGTTFQWYRANDATGAGTAPIVGETSATYRISLFDEGKIIWVGVIPKAATGNTTGEEVESDHEGPVGEATTITFEYDEEDVTYGIITSTVTNRRWMDRNLGAPNMPTANNDWPNYGDLVQFGRPLDGHQLVIRALFINETTPVHPETTTTLSTTDVPVDFKFILTSNDPYDWRNPKNDNLWQAPGQINNPCPAGWHIPTEGEWLAENILDYTVQDAYTKLKITRGGYRAPDGSITGGSHGRYWSSTISGADAKTFYIYNGATTAASQDARGSAALCRCIKDE